MSTIGELGGFLAREAEAAATPAGSAKHNPVPVERTRPLAVPVGVSAQ